MTVAAYWRAGGMPATPLGEDRAFFDALRRMDARIRHAPGAASWSPPVSSARARRYGRYDASACGAA